MTLISIAAKLAERVPMPDALASAGVNLLVDRTRRRMSRERAASDRAFAAQMQSYPIAVNVDEANAQHYEVPASFFAKVLGPRRKYSCCYYEDGAVTLADAELRALIETANHADLRDGQSILELGCGWGSLSLWMAEQFPRGTITAVSNSRSQRAFIESEAARLGLENLSVITADMNDFDPPTRFDRIVSVEMFEHMSNWRTLLARARRWLAHDGRLFLHVFTHRSTSYRFQQDDREDWIAQHFFTGGMMPSHGLVHRFEDLFSVEDEWRWSGEHYARTARDWLTNFDENSNEIDAILAATYGDSASLWRRRWRLFFLATAGLFANDGGRSWGVSHYRLRPQA